MRAYEAAVLRPGPAERCGVLREYHLVTHYLLLVIDRPHLDGFGRGWIVPLSAVAPHPPDLGLVHVVLRVAAGAHVEDAVLPCHPITSKRVGNTK